MNFIFPTYRSNYDAGVLKYPVLLLSDTISAHRREYEIGLQVVHETGDMDSWLRFFLQLLEDTFKKTISDLRIILNRAG